MINRKINKLKIGKANNNKTQPLHDVRFELGEINAPKKRYPMGRINKDPKMYPAPVSFFLFFRFTTTKLTGEIKRSEERAQLYFVRVQRLVMRFLVFLLH